MSSGASAQHASSSSSDRASGEPPDSSLHSAHQPQIGSSPSGRAEGSPRTDSLPGLSIHEWFDEASWW